MKKTLFTLALTTLIAGTVLLGCKSSTKEEKESQENVQDAKDNLNDAKDNLVVAKKAASDQEWNAFKKNTDSIINDNEIRITELKLKIKKGGKTIDAKYKENIDLLDQKNKDLKAKMEAYKNDASSDWQSFKLEFDHDMNELGQSLKDLTVKNTK